MSALYKGMAMNCLAWVTLGGHIKLTDSCQLEHGDVAKSGVRLQDSKTARLNENSSLWERGKVAVPREWPDTGLGHQLLGLERLVRIWLKMASSSLEADELRFTRGIWKRKKYIKSITNPFISKPHNIQPSYITPEIKLSIKIFTSAAQCLNIPYVSSNSRFKDRMITAG